MGGGVIFYITFWEEKLTDTVDICVLITSHFQPPVLSLMTCVRHVLKDGFTGGPRHSSAASLGHQEDGKRSTGDISPLELTASPETTYIELTELKKNVESRNGQHMSQRGS